MYKQILFFVLSYLVVSRLFGQVLDQNQQSKYEKVSEIFVRTALVDQNGYELLRELCKIGPRLSGSENSEKAIKWAKKTFESLGFDRVTLQPVLVPKWVRGDIEKAEIVNSKLFNGKKLNIAALGGSIGTPKNGIIAEVLEVRSFEELRSLSSKAKDKIIFFNRRMDAGNVNTFAAYGGAVDQRISGAVEAAKVGGVGVIIRSVTTKNDNIPHTGVMQYADSVKQIPAVAAGIMDADFLNDALKKDPNLKIKISLACQNLADVQSYNVIADLRGSEKPDQIIVVGGHFDCWDKGVGAHDDGAGCIQSMEALNLFQRLGIKPKRTLRCIFYINEENGFRGASAYGEYADTSREFHIAAIEADRGAGAPRGFYTDADLKVQKKLQSWLPYLDKAEIDWIKSGGTGGDISTIRSRKALFGYAPENQRYFDYHHSGNDVFAAIHPREFELGSAAIAILIYLISEEGL